MEYRNARSKTGEITLRWLVIPLVVVTLAAMLIWVDNTTFYLVMAWIYALVVGNYIFFLWDTRNIPHTLVLDDERLVVHTRSGESTVEWEAIKDVMWKNVVAKRAVVGLFLHDGEEFWIRSVNPVIAKKIEAHWKKV